MTLSVECERYWQAYLATLNPAQGQPPAVIASSPGSPEITDELIDLYLTGKKTAGSGIVEDYESAGDPLTKVGDHWIALSAIGEPRCILRTERVEKHAFMDVPEYVAVAEGEGDLSLDYWRRVHAAHYAPDLHEWGLVSIEQATIVTEFFTLVYPPTAM